MQSLSFSTEVSKRLRSARDELACDAASGGWCVSFEDEYPGLLSGPAASTPSLTTQQQRRNNASLFDFLSVTASSDDGTDSEGSDAITGSRPPSSTSSMDSLTHFLSSKCPSFCLEIEAMEQENISDVGISLDSLDSLDGPTGKFVALSISDKEALSASTSPSSSPPPSLLIAGRAC